jgi:hypothetical protein
VLALRIWQDHLARDKYFSFQEAKQAYEAWFPGCDVRRHLYWRYSAIWQKNGTLLEERSSESADRSGPGLDRHAGKAAVDKEVGAGDESAGGGGE